jgi:sugar phosphate isomerase/epimerase
MLSFPDLVLCEATIRPCRLEEFVEAARLSGCAAISLRAATAMEALSRLGSAGVSSLLRSSDVHVADIDAMVGWLRDGGARWPPQIPVSARMEPERILELAATFGARAVNVVELSDSPFPVDEIAERFGWVCDQAARHGMIAYLEFFRGSVIRDMAAAGDVVRRAGRNNGGILLDTLHYYRGPSYAGGQLAGNVSLVRMLQLSDVPARPPVDQWKERQEGRLIPGEGAIDLVAVLSAIHDSGVDAPVGMEVSSAALRSMDPADAALIAAKATRSLLDLVGDHRQGDQR